MGRGVQEESPDGDMAAVGSVAEPDDNALRGGVYVAHEGDLGTALCEVLLIDADSVAPDISALGWVSAMSRG